MVQNFPIRLHLHTPGSVHTLPAVACLENSIHLHESNSLDRQTSRYSVFRAAYDETLLVGRCCYKSIYLKPAFLQIDSNCGSRPVALPADSPLLAPASSRRRIAIQTAIRRGSVPVAGQDRYADREYSQSATHLLLQHQWLVQII